MTRKQGANRDGEETGGMTIREVAKALGVSRGTVLSDERSALAKIRAGFEAKFGSSQIAREVLFG